MLRIYRRYFGTLVKHPDDPVMTPARQYQDVLQYLSADGKWDDVPVVIDAESLNKANAFQRQWDPLGQMPTEMSPVEIQQEMPL